MQKATPPSLAGIVFQHVGQQIITGELAAGDSISDNAIAAALNVSRTPVREALQRLERIGMIEFAPSRFTRVTSLAPEDVSHWREYVGHQLSALVRTAAARFTEDARAEAADRVDAIAARVDDSAHRARASAELYAHLAAHSRNDVHQMMFHETSFAMIRALGAWVVDSELSAQVAGSLDRLSAALRAGDREAAERSARAAYLVE
ncbi:GntR family transcriptional regulator [uncultured Microbacterium sp.]|uniref:GntR family transcriptional regulator n=1 Tax=uncultured Microbacterium sp. TaxID=191216 RepID=UPI0028D0B3C8|nr:GntR family transcriptional regulator [uncultured Microbacterium sp.]